MGLSWTQSICDECYNDKFPDRPNPVRVKFNAEFSIEDICNYCGKVNSSGIYIRDDPATVKYPREKKG